MVPVGDPVLVALGKFGPWQARSLLLLALVKIPAAWHMLSILFLAPNPETFGGSYFCARDIQQNMKISPQEWVERWHPENKRYPLGFDPCYIYKTFGNYTNLEPISDQEPELLECPRFEFFVQQPTMVTQWSLVCKKSVLVNVVQFFYLLGITSGGVVTLFLLKRFSPQMLILVGSALQVSAGIAGSLQPVFEVHCLLKTLIGLGLCLMFTASYQIIVDISFGWRKMVFGASFELFWSIGVISLGWLNEVAGSWSNLHLMISIPSLIFLILLWIMPDSPRWLIAHGKFTDADNLLKFAAACNGKKLPDDFSTQKPANTSPNSSSRSSRLPKLRTFCLQIIWIGTVVNYYGALLNTKNVGGTSLPLRTTIAGGSEIIGTALGILLLLKPKYKFGFLSLLLTIGGTFCVSSWAIPPSESGSRGGWTMIWLAFVGRISIACSLAVMTNGSADLIPADRRPVIMTTMVTIARMVLMTAPFLNSLAFYGESITLSFYGSLALLAAVGAFCIFLSTECREIDFSVAKNVWNVQNTFKPREAEVVGTHFNPCYVYDEVFETRIST